jgi:hypothetical protein
MREAGHLQPALHRHYWTSEGAQGTMKILEGIIDGGKCSKYAFKPYKTAALTFSVNSKHGKHQEN